MAVDEDLQTTIRDLVQKGKGILAADESLPTIGKRFKAVVVGSAAARQHVLGADAACKEYVDLVAVSIAAPTKAAPLHRRTRVPLPASCVSPSRR